MFYIIYVKLCISIYIKLKCDAILQDAAPTTKAQFLHGYITWQV